MADPGNHRHESRGGTTRWRVPINSPDEARKIAIEVQEAIQYHSANGAGLEVVLRPRINIYDTAFNPRRGARPVAPPPQIKTVIQTCANCGQEGHTLKICLKPSPQGDIPGCPRCNTKDHVYDFCPRTEWTQKEHEYYLTETRGNRPPIRTKVWWLEVSAASEKITFDYYPHTKRFAQSMLEEDRTKIWEKGQFDYAKNDSSLLASDPLTSDFLTITESLKAGYLHYEFFIPPTKRLDNPARVTDPEMEKKVKEAEKLRESIEDKRKQLAEIEEQITWLKKAQQN